MISSWIQGVHPRRDLKEYLYIYSSIYCRFQILHLLAIEKVTPCTGCTINLTYIYQSDFLPFPAKTSLYRSHPWAHLAPVITKASCWHLRIFKWTQSMVVGRSSDRSPCFPCLLGLPPRPCGTKDGKASRHLEKRKQWFPSEISRCSFGKGINMRAGVRKGGGKRARWFLRVGVRVLHCIRLVLGWDEWNFIVGGFWLWK